MQRGGDQGGGGMTHKTEAGLWRDAFGLIEQHFAGSEYDAARDRVERELAAIQRYIATIDGEAHKDNVNELRTARRAPHGISAQGWRDRPASANRWSTCGNGNLPLAPTGPTAPWPW